MSGFDPVFKLFDGPDDLARSISAVIGEPVKIVRRRIYHWIERNSVPPRYHAPLMKVSIKRGLRRDFDPMRAWESRLDADDKPEARRKRAKR